MERTEEHMLAEYAKKMGAELGPLFHALSSELSWIHWRWKQYRILFSEKRSRIHLLNASAPLFFQIIHNVLFEDTLLSIARLVSPAKSAGKQNLTFLDYRTQSKRWGCEAKSLI